MPHEQGVTQATADNVSPQLLPTDCQLSMFTASCVQTTSTVSRSHYPTPGGRTHSILPFWCTLFSKSYLPTVTRDFRNWLISCGENQTNSYKSKFLFLLPARQGLSEQANRPHWIQSRDSPFHLQVLGLLLAGTAMPSDINFPVADNDQLDHSVTETALLRMFPVLNLLLSLLRTDHCLAPLKTALRSTFPEAATLNRNPSSSSRLYRLLFVWRETSSQTSEQRLRNNCTLQPL